MDDIFGGDGEINITDDLISKNGLSYKKGELCELVVSKIDEKTIVPDEIQEKLFSVVDAIVTF